MANQWQSGFLRDDTSGALVVSGSAQSGSGAILPWATATAYVQGQPATNGSHTYTANDAHTSGATFAGDLATHWTLLPTGLVSGYPLTFAQPGTLIAAAGVGRVRIPQNATIVSVAAVVDTAPTGASIKVDVNKNGTTIFTTQANRPTIAISGFDSGDAFPDVTSVVAGDYLTADADQVGSTIAGANLTITVYLLVALPNGDTPTGVAPHTHTNIGAPNTQTTDYTLTLADAGLAVEMSSGSARVLTIPPNSSVAFVTGTVIELARIGAGSVTITPGAGVTIPNRVEAAGTSSRTVSHQYSSASIRKRATNEWLLVGDIA